jgi:hypothetical protein
VGRLGRPDRRFLAVPRVRWLPWVLVGQAGRRVLVLRGLLGVRVVPGLLALQPLPAWVPRPGRALLALLGVRWGRTLLVVPGVRGVLGFLAGRRCLGVLGCRPLLALPVVLEVLAVLGVPVGKACTEEEWLARTGQLGACLGLQGRRGLRACRAFRAFLAVPVGRAGLAGSSPRMMGPG